MGSGRNSFFGWVPETTWGTPVTPPTKFAEIGSDAFAAVRTRPPRETIRGLDPAESDTYDELFGAGGGGVIKANYGGMLRLIEHLFGDSSGATVATEPGVRSTHTFTPKDTPLVGKGLTVYKNTDTDSGSLPCEQYSGYKIVRGTFTFDPRKHFEFEFEGVAKEVAQVAAPTPVYPSIANYIAGHQTIVKIDTVAVATESADWTLDQALRVDKRILGSKNIAEPEHGDSKRVISGKLTVTAAQAHLAKYLAGTYFQLEIISTGATLGSGNYMFSVTFPKCQLLANPYQVTGPGVLSSVLSWQAHKAAASEICTLVVVNDEAAIA